MARPPPHPPGKARSGCSRAVPTARREGAKGRSRTGKLRAGWVFFWGGGTRKEEEAVGTSRITGTRIRMLAAPCPVTASGNFR